MSMVRKWATSSPVSGEQTPWPRQQAEPLSLGRLVVLRGLAAPC